MFNINLGDFMRDGLSAAVDIIVPDAIGFGDMVHFCPNPLLFFTHLSHCRDLRRNGEEDYRKDRGFAA
jgi:hypothetical protein